ncbi:MAG: saccharopine dehydrogenase NADP-binding domain-containing protein [Thermoleophilia bacterium]|nr:saccharopine dehydrogenase NADP-binding domain-containing protein [Thermoleophilia bacterium]
MSFNEESRAPIAVYGTTGYTGKLIAAELAKTDLDFVLAGRNQAKLEAVAADLGIDVPLHAIPNTDSKGLRDLFGDCGAVIACAGPFYLHGEPVLAAAAAAGTHYLDTTGEQPFIQLGLDKYGPIAAKNGSAVVPAMGFDYVPGDMIAALTALGMGDLDTVRLAYAVKMQPTRGTMLSALDMMKGADLEWRGGGLRPAEQSISRGKFDFGGQLGVQAMARYPAGEHVTVPRHVETKRVETMLSASSMVPGPLARVAPLIMRPASLAMRTPFKALASKVVNRLPEGAEAEARANSAWTIDCEAIAGDRVRRGTISGKDVYGLTAALLVKGATLAVSGGLRGTGGLAPAQAFEAESFLADLDGFEVEWSVEPLPEETGRLTPG